MNKRLLIAIFTLTLATVSVGTYYTLTSVENEINLRDSGSYTTLTIQRHWFSLTLVNKGEYTINGDFNATVIMRAEERYVFNFTGTVENLVTESSQEILLYESAELNFEDSDVQYYYVELKIYGYEPITMTLNC